MYCKCRNYALPEVVCPNKLRPVQEICIRVCDNGLCRDSPCFRLDDVLYLYPSGECGRYMRCDSGWAVFVECETPGFVWKQPPCGPPPPPPTTTKTTNPPATTPFDCPSCDGNYATLNLPCPAFYWQCSNELSYDHTKNSCVRIENNPYCLKNPCEGSIAGVCPDPKCKCDSYMHCLNGRAVFIQYANGEHVCNDAAEQCSPRSQTAALVKACQQGCSMLVFASGSDVFAAFERQNENRPQSNEVKDTQTRGHCEKGYNYCVRCFHEKYAPRCAICRQPIVPQEGSEDSVRVVAMDKSFHVDCYKCEDCGRKLSSKIEGGGCYPLDEHLYCKGCNAERVRSLSAQS